MRDAAPRVRLCSFLPFGSCLFPGLPGMLGRGVRLDALGPVGAGRLTQQQPLAKEAVAGRHGIPPATGHLRGGDALRAAITSSGKFPGPKRGRKRLIQGKTAFWLFARGSCLLSPVFSSATELFCNAGNFTCLLCASVFLITRRKIIQASFPRELRGFVNEHDKVLWDPWLKAQP